MDQLDRESDLTRGEYLRQHVPVSVIANEPTESKIARTEAARLARTQTLMAWESESASPHSPGPVLPSELLRRSIRANRDLTPDGLATEAFHDLKDLGLSCDRVGHATALESLERTQKNFAAKGHEVGGYVEISVDFVRSLQCRLLALKQECRAAGVYDSAEVKNHSHAEIFAITHVTKKAPYSDLKTDLVKHCKENKNIQAWPEIATPTADQDNPAV